MLRVVGAGLPRTGTRSLKEALERLLGGRCYHMSVLFRHPEDLPSWRAAPRGDETDWSAFPPDSVAAVEWPASAFWREFAAYYERHNELVRREAPADRLLDWRATDAWEPLCRALGLPAPDEPFPPTNARAEWNA